jgi:antirestriction protein ArdC
MRKSKKKIDVYQEVTDNFIAAIEAGGVLPWKKSWTVSGAGRPTRITGEYYQGINQLILMSTPYSNPNWMTFRAAQEAVGLKKDEKGKFIYEEGKGVRAGEKSTRIVKYLVGGKKGKDGKIAKKDQFFFPVFHNVFNAEQIDGLPEKFFPKPAEKQQTGKQNKAIDKFFNKLAPYKHAGDQAYYRPSTDEIVMPEFDQFKTPEDYYGTLAHEFAHWTKHKDRCNRDMKSYGAEELVAEISAAMTMSRLGLASSDTLRDDHVQYVQAWLDNMKEDKKAIFNAAKFATAATDFIMGDTSKTTQLEEAA